MAELGLSLLSSALVGIAVSVLSWLRRRHRVERMRQFFGVRAGERPVLVVARHVSSSNDRSVQINDAAAVVDVAAALVSCGARPELVANDQAPASLGAVTEVCVGGPSSNARVEAHVRLLLPGVDYAKSTDDPSMTITVGGNTFARDGDLCFALLAKVFGRNGGAPVFLICGHLALSNRAAARYLAEHHQELARTHGLDGPFALILSLRGVFDYGADAIESVEDVTAAAFPPPASP